MKQVTHETTNHMNMSHRTYTKVVIFMKKTRINQYDNPLSINTQDSPT